MLHDATWCQWIPTIPHYDATLGNHTIPLNPEWSSVFLLSLCSEWSPTKWFPCGSKLPLFHPTMLQCTSASHCAMLWKDATVRFWGAMYWKLLRLKSRLRKLFSLLECMPCGCFLATPCVKYHEMLHNMLPYYIYPSDVLPCGATIKLQGARYHVKAFCWNDDWSLTYGLFVVVANGC